MDILVGLDFYFMVRTFCEVHIFVSMIHPRQSPVIANVRGRGAGRVPMRQRLGGSFMSLGRGGSGCLTGPGRRRGRCGEVVYICARVDQLPLFPYNRGWSSTQVRRGLYTHYKDSLLKVGWPSPIQRV